MPQEKPKPESGTMAMHENLAAAEAYINQLLEATPRAVVAERMRRARTTQGVSIRDLASRAAVSKTSIVNLEKGISCRPITILKISLALNLHVDRFFSNHEEVDTEVAIHRTEDDRWYPLSDTGTGTIGGLNRALSVEERIQFHSAGVGAQMLMFKSRLEDSKFWSGLIEVSERTPLTQHAGHEFVYVLSGNLILEVGERRMSLLVGESAAFKASQSHSYGPGGASPCTFLCVRID